MLGFLCHKIRFLLNKLTTYPLGKVDKLSTNSQFACQVRPPLPPVFPVSLTCPCGVPKVSPKLTESGSLWAEFQGHSECATQEHFGAIVLVRFEFY